MFSCFSALLISLFLLCNFQIGYKTLFQSIFLSCSLRYLQIKKKQPEVQKIVHLLVVLTHIFYHSNILRLQTSSECYKLSIQYLD